MNVPFSAKDEWISDLFQQSSDYTFRFPTATVMSRRVFDLLLPILHHDSMHYEEKFLEQIKLVWFDKENITSSSLASTFPCKNVRGLIRGARELTGTPVRVRNTAIRINAKNKFTEQFCPPKPERVEGALRTMLYKSNFDLCVGNARVESAHKERNITAAAVCTYVVFLTIHPFMDGNGRTARYYFAGCVYNILRLAPVLLIALALMHQMRSSGFHLACRCARMGDFYGVLSLYQENIFRVSEVVGSQLESLSASVSEGHADCAFNSLLAIRKRLSTYLLN